MHLRALAPLLTAQGPFATLYLPTHRRTDNAGPAFDVLWKDVLRQLDDAGVDRATRDALDAGRGSHTDGGTVVLVGAAGELLLRVALPEAQDTTLVRVGTLPALLPLLDWAQTRVPHLVVLADRRGADVLGYGDGDEPTQVGTVDESRHPVHKVRSGGWNERRYQRNVEDSWAQTGRDIAAAVEQIARDVSARVILLGGDEREVGLVRDALPTDLAALVTTIDGQRAEDGGSDHVAEAVLQGLAGHLAAEVEDLLERFATYRGRATKDRARPLTDDEGNHDVALNAADGPSEVVEALRMAQVGTLLLSEDLDEARRVWIGPQPLHLGLTHEEITALGADEPVEAPLGDALARAALGSDAEVRFVPAGTDRSPSEGVGALLRYSTPRD